VTLRLNKWLVTAWIVVSVLSVLVIIEIFTPINIGDISPLQRAEASAVAWICFSLMAIIFNDRK